MKKKGGGQFTNYEQVTRNMEQEKSIKSYK